MAFASGAVPIYHHDTGESYMDAGQSHQLHQHHHYVNPSVQDPTQSGYYNPNVPHQMSCDIKPRLTKEQHDILEAHYQAQNKPNTNTKKGFAESLNVSLDKVNNWFQNRRAKAKQDAKKAQGAFNLFSQQQQQQQSSVSLNFNSDSEPSPAFSSAEYYTMMQHCASEEQLPMPNAIPNGLPNGMGMDQGQQYQDTTSNGTGEASNEEQRNHFGMPQQLSVNMFESPQELNRRTLTQEQFDAFANTNGMMQPEGQFDAFHNDFSGDADVMHQVFPDINGHEFKGDTFSFPVPIPPPMGSNDSSIPSSISEHNMFPSSTAMQDQASMSATTSEWADSRSSSVSVGPSQDSAFKPASAPTQQTGLISSKWQPGQSIPVDPEALQRHFQQVSSQRQAQQQQQVQQEQPLAWPSDEAYVRRESSSQNMLAQQMSSFAIQTPQPPQSATFKCPPPPAEGSSSIAARRQRPRPATLGLASLRSQSYSGAAQPNSPSGTHSQNLATTDQQLRRIRSSNVINAVAQGRVMKSGTTSAQRSPLSWTFADAMNSPKTARHASTGSSGNLAPPTPLSPTEGQAPRQESVRGQFPPWQSSSGHFSRQASISETDAEHNIPVMSTATAQQQTTSSPPQTPMFHHHQQFSNQFGPSRIGNNVITENTPPQSAPACQQTFPSDVFAMPQQQSMQAQPQPAFISAQQQPFLNVSVPEQQYQMPAAYYPVSMPEAQLQSSMQFANGVPVVNAQGNLTMAFPPQMQQMQFVQQMPSQPVQGQPGQYNFMTTAPAPGMQVTAQLPKQQMQPATEFFVHEYSPPQDIKRSATVRKVPAENNGPKNYTFANQGPEHFEKDKSKKGQETKSSSTASSSPASAASTS